MIDHEPAIGNYVISGYLHEDSRGRLNYLNQSEGESLAQGQFYYLLLLPCNTTLTADWGIYISIGTWQANRASGLGTPSTGN